MAGAGYKLFNTGDVLTAAQVNTYLQEQAVMRFATTTARTTALASVLAEGMITYIDATDSLEFYNGTSWVAVSTTAGDITAVTAGTGISGGGTSGAVTITNSMATEITAKGDLIVGTGNATFDNLAVGTNDYVLLAASGETTGLKWGGTWTTWTPTYNDLTVGNGTVTARYLKLGKTVFFDFILSFGSTTSITSTAPSFNLPSNSKTDVFFFDGNILDAGTVNYGGAGQVLANTSRVYWKVYNVAGTYPSPSNATSTVPMTWTTNDVYQLHGFYEEA